MSKDEMQIVKERMKEINEYLRDFEYAYKRIKEILEGANVHAYLKIEKLVDEKNWEYVGTVDTFPETENIYDSVRDKFGHGVFKCSLRGDKGKISKIGNTDILSFAPFIVEV